MKEFAFRSRFPALAAFILFLAVQAAAALDRHVIVVSVDGLLPEFYLSASNRAVCETLNVLREQGSCARAMQTIYPSVTYASHAALSTGVSPARNGITANNKFEPRYVNGRGFWFAKDLLAPAIWDAAQKAGCTVGAVSWPVSAGSTAIDWNLPEFWTSFYGTEDALIRRYERGGLVERAGMAGRRLENVQLDNMAARDSFMTFVAVDIIRRDKPGLLLVHLIDLDHTEHESGRASPEAKEAMRRIDGHLHEIVGAARAAGIIGRTTFIILGDHGSADVQTALAPNLLLLRHGFIETRDGRVDTWRALVQNTGGSAAVYLQDPSDTKTASAVLSLLEKNSRGTDGRPMFTVVDRRELTALGGPAKAAFCLEAEPGYMFSESLKGSSWIRRAGLKGNHGYRPGKPEMLTGFVAIGAGIRPGVVLDKIRVTDVAPTIAALLGLRFDTPEGRVLRELLK